MPSDEKPPKRTLVVVRVQTNSDGITTTKIRKRKKDNSVYETVIKDNPGVGLIATVERINKK